jgi:phytoene desaturase
MFYLCLSNRLIAHNLKHNRSEQKIAILGAGVAGVASAIRLAAAGYTVTVYEQSDTYGGKMGVWQSDGYRWDTGPSLFTMPQYVDELLSIDGQHDIPFKYEELETICNYFWDDGTRLTATKNRKQLLIEFFQKLGERPETINAHLKDSETKFQITNHVFLEKSLHKISTYLNWGTLKSIFRLSKVEVFKNMHTQNAKRFSNPKTTQFFDRYATYNGSNPYQAPATLNIIPHYEFGIGAFFPKEGIRSIADALYTKAVNLGVQFQFETRVDSVVKRNGIFVINESEEYHIVLCNMDVAFAARGPLKSLIGDSSKDYEPSSSALIFYWGMKSSYKELDVHNIFFSNDYKKEFANIFKNKRIDTDPTVYLHISSKMNANDAPEGGENWFVMVNAPFDDNQDWETIIAHARKNIIAKLEKIIERDIAGDIRVEHQLTPQLIMSKTGSYKGALYGTSSNNKMSAFLRQANFSSKHKGLYFCGGSVHPGGGIPLCLLSAKISTDIIRGDY